MSIHKGLRKRPAKTLDQKYGSAENRVCKKCGAMFAFREDKEKHEASCVSE